MAGLAQLSSFLYPAVPAIQSESSFLTLASHLNPSDSS
ncbi:hypothetical protein CCACVL1_28186 [Corchorus capsularis]|uniref:Uncharacterized protein n=1 Tax=Corchorus capsularis TaxID=210143 RepID=A0A1R3G7F7_COCAP|nr:hypothetical protein CCACVL1_28186 [Corchorus capsularis]